MVDREKVVKGLQICREFDGDKCPECPYSADNECLAAIASDALELIAELEAANSEAGTVEYALNILRANGWKEDRNHEFKP